MQDRFQQLEEVLQSIEAWIENSADKPFDPSERKLLNTLKRYARHCRQDKTKWFSEKEAELAMIKLNRSWYVLVRGQYRKK